MQLLEGDTQYETVQIGTLPYLGKAISLEAQCGKYGHCYQGDVNAPSENDRLILHIALKKSGAVFNREHIEEALRGWLKGRSLQYFTERARALSRRSGLSPSKIALTSAGRRWGSCSSNKTIRLNWRLIHLKPILIDYVIAHEFAHLRQMNHSPAFWAEVQNLMPNYRIHELAFKDICINDLNIVYTNPSYK